MILKIIKQTWHEARRQPVISIVSVVATAFTIFLVMTMSVIDRVKTAEFTPETNRSRMLVATGVHIEDDNGGGSSPLSIPFLHELYDSIDGVEALAIFTANPDPIDVSVPGKAPLNLNYKGVDNGFWKVFEFEFIAGSPFDTEKVVWDNTGSVPVVVTESVARRLYGTTDVVGNLLDVTRIPRRICGVVKDVSPLASLAYAQLYFPIYYEPGPVAMDRSAFFGRCNGAVLARSKEDFSSIRTEVAERYKAINRRINPFGWEIIPHDQPYTVAEAATVRGTNSNPEERSYWWVPYLLLILVPAINLSSMTSSLLRRRRIEIGVRRAFGASIAKIMVGVLTENLMVTVIGAAIGLGVSWLFVWLGIGYLVSPNITVRLFLPVSVSPAVLFSWVTFGIAAGTALLLNIFSSGLPAWNAARRNPVEALSGHEK